MYLILDEMDFSIRNQVSAEEPDEEREISMGTGPLNTREVGLKDSLKLKDENSSWKKGGIVPGGTSSIVCTKPPTGVIKTHDVNSSQPEKGFLSKCKENANVALSKVVAMLLDNMGKPLKLQMIASYLMVAGGYEEGQSGYGCLEGGNNQVINPDKDSGIHSGLSNQGGQLHKPVIPAKGEAPPLAPERKNLPDLDLLLDQEVQFDGKSELKSTEELEKSDEEIGPREEDGYAQAQAPAAQGQVPQGHGAGSPITSPKQRKARPSLSKRFDARSHKNIPLADEVNQAVPIPKVVSIRESVRALSQSLSIPQGTVKYTNKEEMLDFVTVIGLDRVSEDTGVFLKEFAPIFEINRRHNFFKEGTDYWRMKSFLKTKEVYLCQSYLTGKQFVTKWVPIVEEEDTGRRRKVLQRRQQVDLVVSHQDSCPWGGLVPIYGLIRRKHGGRDFAEIFMEYCEGDTLLNQKPFLKEMADHKFLKFAEKLVEIFKYLHDHDIVHGDTKGENAGYRFDCPTLFDFEAAKHPRYKINSRGTYQYVPYWVHQCFQQRTFDLLKTLDLWGIGIIFLMIRYDRIMYAQEQMDLRACDTCEGVCAHLKKKFLRQIEACPGLVNKYLPPFGGSSSEKMLVSLVRGFLTSGGLETQFNTQDALDILQGGYIAVHIMNDDIQNMKPILIPKGTRMKDFIRNSALTAAPQYKDGFWLSVDGKRNVDLNQTLTDCCLFHIHPTGPTKATMDM